MDDVQTVAALRNYADSCESETDADDGSFAVFVPKTLSGEFHDDLKAAAARIESLAERVRELEAQRGNIRFAGTMLANCAFNLAQRPHLTDNERRFLDESRRAWDSAMQQDGGGREG